MDHNFNQKPKDRSISEFKTMLLTHVQKRIAVLLAFFAAASAGGGIVWSNSGGGWRAMAATSAYAQVFSHLGLLGGGTSPNNNGTSTQKIGIVTTTSGSSWWSAQFFFSSQYHDAVVGGTPNSLGGFTQQWLEAYASTQANVSFSCGPFANICSELPSDSPLASTLPLAGVAESFNYSWAAVMYAMFNATSETYGDADMATVSATSGEKLSSLGVDICFHTSMIPNVRSRESNTITYLAKDTDNVSSAYTTLLPFDWCVSEDTEEWNTALPGGHVYPAPTEFVGSTAYAEFPLFPVSQSDTLYTAPEGNMTSSIAAESMFKPFGGSPTAVQIATVSSSDVAYMSEETVTYFAQYMSVINAGIEADNNLTRVQKLELREALDKVQDDLWSSGLLAFAATNSAWTNPDPTNIPAGQEDNYWFADGGFTDGPGVAGGIARYQHKFGTDDEIKLIICNSNYETDNMNNILGYFSTTWNQGIDPGQFIWPQGVGSGPQNNPQQSKQIFQDYMDEESLSALEKHINGTNITMATFSATTIDNGE